MEPVAPTQGSIGRPGAANQVAGLDATSKTAPLAALVVHRSSTCGQHALILGWNMLKPSACVWNRLSFPVSNRDGTVFILFSMDFDGGTWWKAHDKHVYTAWCFVHLCYLIEDTATPVPGTSSSLGVKLWLPRSFDIPKNRQITIMGSLKKQHGNYTFIIYK